MSETDLNTEVVRQQQIKRELISLKTRKKTAAKGEKSGIMIFFLEFSPLTGHRK